MNKQTKKKCFHDSFRNTNYTRSAGSHLHQFVCFFLTMSASRKTETNRLIQYDSHTHKQITNKYSGVSGHFFLLLDLNAYKQFKRVILIFFVF
jgi:hypothetical protein